MPTFARGLYAIIPTHAQLNENELFERVIQLITAGCPVLQYRDKFGTPAVKLRRAQQLKALCAAGATQLIINDDPALAAEVGAAGVHLGQGDMSIHEARQIVGSAIIGATCHGSLSLAQQALEDGADYLAFGRFFPSQTKGEAPPAELAILHQAKALGLPTVGIGGVTLANAPLLIDAGADSIAVSHDIFSLPAAQIAARARAYQNLFAVQDTP